MIPRFEDQIERNGFVSRTKKPYRFAVPNGITDFPSSVRSQQILAGNFVFPRIRPDKFELTVNRFGSRRVGPARIPRPNAQESPQAGSEQPAARGGGQAKFLLFPRIFSAKN